MRGADQRRHLGYRRRARAGLRVGRPSGRPLMERAVELCRDHGAGCRTRSGTAESAGEWGRRHRGRRVAQLVPPDAVPARRPGRTVVIVETFETACTWDRFSAAARGRRGRSDGGARIGGRPRRAHLPLHARLPRRPGARTSASTRAGRRAPRCNSGTRSRRRCPRRSSPTGRRSPTITPSVATTARGTTGSGPTRSRRRCAAAKSALDPAGILNPGVLIDVPSGQ